MTDKKSKSIARIVAHIFSDLFSPLLTPTIGMIAAMWLTRLHYLPLGVRLWATLGVAVITALVPMIVIGVLMKLGKVSDASISHSEQRTLPYCASILCFLVAALYLNGMSAPAWLSFFYVGAAIVSALSLLITHWWKISAHAGGVGGLCALIYYLARNGLIEYGALWWLSAAVMVVGIVAWSRLYLERHTLMQVFAGAALAFAIEYSIVSIFQ